jgi:LysR family glycine cleavage system transcriptional activator
VEKSYYLVQVRELCFFTLTNRSFGVFMPPPRVIAASTLSRLPPLTALRSFVVAARHLSFARAADELHVTPAAVGHQVRQLEAFLGRPLFRRIARQLELTDEGHALIPGLTAAFEGMVDAVARLGSADLLAPLAISATPSFAGKWLVPRLSAFRAAHPDIELRIAASMALVDFDSEEVDCAIRFGTGNYPGLYVEKLLDESVFPVCSPALLEGDEPLDRPDRLKHHTLLHDRSSQDEAGFPDWRMWLLAAGLDGVNPGLGPQFDQSTLTLEAAIAGQGVALAKASLAESDLRAGRLVRPFGDAQRVAFAYYFVCPPAKRALARVRAFHDWLRRETRSEPGELLRQAG